jgi:hypothetical protein
MATAFRTGWLRRFTLGSGPLKRRSDRVQALARVVVAVSLLAAPALAGVATDTTRASLEARATEQEAHRHRTDAVLLEEAPAARHATDGDGRDGAPRTVPAPAAWTGPDGGTREGQVPALPGSPPGTAVPVWVDDDGALAQPPLDRAGIGSSAGTMGLLALVAVPLGTWTCYVVLCCALDAGLDRRWTEGWAAVEPVWATRLL